MNIIYGEDLSLSVLQVLETRMESYTVLENKQQTPVLCI